MQVEIWSDVVCPWCYIGKRRFEAALAEFEHRDDVDMVWRAFELDPNGPPVREGDYIGRIARKYGTSPEQAAKSIERMVDAGAGDGLELRFDKIRGGNTFDAHRLLHLALERGVQDELKERFFRATFTEGETIGLPETLAKLAVDVGLDADEVDEVLAGDRYTDEVRIDEVQARRYGITAVPFFVIDSRVGVAGAQSPDVLLDVLNQAWAERSPLQVVAEDDTGVCEGDECVV